MHSSECKSLCPPHCLPSHRTLRWKNPNLTPNPVANDLVHCPLLLGVEKRFGWSKCFKSPPPHFFFWKSPLILPRLSSLFFWSPSPLPCGFSLHVDGSFELAGCYKWGLSLYYAVGNFKDMKSNGAKKDSKVLMEEFLPNIILKIISIWTFSHQVSHWQDEDLRAHGL